VIDNQDIELLPATLGLIYVFPTTGLPQSVEMEWDIFSEKMQRVPSASVDQAGPLPVILEPDFNVLRWDNYLKHPDIPTLVAIQPPPGMTQKVAAWGQWVMLGLSLLVVVHIVRSRKAGGSLSGTALAALAINGALTRYNFVIGVSCRFSTIFTMVHSSGCSCMALTRRQRRSASSSIAASRCSFPSAIRCFVLPIWPSQSTILRRRPSNSGS